ncbi:28 kDa heat- and acid-stable phosphoprotein-like [Drosophila kikkawai]|uniref:28 kDa heat- and acid-stable phosphoprotein-like n=1 Tax=Drosophila kikkawai TaxID=30033 RepID=A0A6P4IZB9_DROKI|nr:28 kDa heat- and acid-stable phosphoprotein-like [Drosophila kikkawai]XP_017033925.1 28 kDa heat- and acid-stable phosphoprotein-like [Drosophila kikkawai]XP_017033926.1 28 kDa heat- and acid-stable phosphoprotein-like [Drosophila kikkawai]
MPRGKYVNHKGRCRQFTSSDQLQQELGMIMDKDKVQGLSQDEGEANINLGDLSDYDNEYLPEKKSIRGIHNLIEVFNPNRMPHDQQIVSQKDNARDERKQRQGPRKSQVQADLERLFIVRKEREAAAERRLAAKKAAAEADALRLVFSLKKLTKQCPVDEMNSPKGLALRGK